MADYTTVDDSSSAFQAEAYTGGGANSTVTFSGNSDLQPDLLWIKRRNAGYGHNLFDTTRGIAKLLEPDNNNQENTNQTWISGVASDSFTIGVNEHNLSNSGGTYVAWAWKCNGGTTSTNSDGDINSTVQTNSDTGFSIITDSPGNNTAKTIGHGLGAKPDFIIRRARNRTEDWNVYHSAFFSTLGGGFWGLNTAASYNDGANTQGYTSMSNTTFGVGTDYSINGNYNYVTYAWKSVQGYSKFGKYIGNGSGTSDGTFDGPMVYTGFKPAWLMVKRATNSSGDEWIIWDSARPPRGTTTSSNNYINNKLYANTTAAESGNVYDAVDFLSNGFKIRTGRAGANASGDTYIYAAFAENPLVTSTGVPATAR